MEIFEMSGDIGAIGKNITGDDLTDILSEGITVLSGNRVLKLSVTEETSLPDQALKDNYNQAIATATEKLRGQFEDEKKVLTDDYHKRISILDKQKDELEHLKRELRPVPNVDVQHAIEGLSVAKTSDGYVWFYNCVYAPKFVNNKRIDPGFSKRLITPITIRMYVIDGQCVDMKVMCIIGDKKFRHYHSLSGSEDCWGDFRYSGEDVSDQSKALNLGKKTLAVLETVNGFSIGTENPSGLPRFSTLENHLVDNGVDVEENTKLNTRHTRHTRTGIEVDVNTDINDNVWTLDS